MCVFCVCVCKGIDCYNVTHNHNNNSDRTFFFPVALDLILLPKYEYELRAHTTTESFESFVANVIIRTTQHTHSTHTNTVLFSQSAAVQRLLLSLALCECRQVDNHGGATREKGVGGEGPILGHLSQNVSKPTPP